MARLFKDMSLEELRDHARRASTYYGVVQNYIEALEAECFKLAAGACEHRGGKGFVKKAGRKQRNIVAACRKCNNSRGNMDAHTFKSTMRPHV